MRLLVPSENDAIGAVDASRVIGAEVRTHASGTPWVFTNMVTSIDGAAVVDGRSGGLGGPGDRLVFSALRSQADVIVVGAETVRVERYRLPRRPTRLCIVTRSATLPHDLPLFDELDGPPGRAHADPWPRPIIATIGAVADRAVGDGFDERFDVVALGDDTVDLTRLVGELGDRGLGRILCEGGPSLLAQLGADGLVDEWNFTIAPLITGGSSTRPVHSATSFRQTLTLDRLLLDDDASMFARYLSRPAP